MKLFHKILIANRGEIAVRIIRTLKKMGITVVAIYSDIDREALHVRLADESYLLNGRSLSETYLDMDKIIRIAIESDADAIHPGYGFLSENALFARKVSESGLNFIGPTPDTIGLMGNKLEARASVRKAGIPLIEGLEGNIDAILGHVDQLDFPLLVKAAAGGGGKAMRIVRKPEDLKDALEASSREAYNYFGDPSLYAEKYFENARHIEIQVLADHYGKIIIAGERECSVQRRYQKVIEESPSVFLDEDTRQRMIETSRQLVETIGYVNAGTIEYLVDENQRYYFLEMNTRIQVEHPVTEMVRRLDIVEQQVLIAAGNRLGIDENDIHPKGHAIQARIYAEDPAKDFLPSPGRIHAYHEPDLPGLRIDSAIDGNFDLQPDFDPLVAKVIAHGHDREEARGLLKKALENYILLGTISNREFLISLLENPKFIGNNISTNFLERINSDLNFEVKQRKAALDKMDVFSAWLAWVLFVDGKKSELSLWNNIGYWRHQIRKSFFFEGQQYDLLIEDYHAGGLSFYVDGQIHRLQLKSFNHPRIMLERNGKWFTASAITGKGIEDLVFINGLEYRIKPLDFLPADPFLKDEFGSGSTGPWIIKSPLHGKIVKMNAMINRRVIKGEHLFTLDAMKMENKIVAPFGGCVKEIRASLGDQVMINQPVMIIDECEEVTNS